MKSLLHSTPRWLPTKTVLSLLLVAGLLGTLFLSYHVGTRINPNREHQVGDRIDSLNGVAIYFNGGVNNVVSRNLSADGYNLGLSYQCVEFVKRYYYERFGHRMPDSYGHARDFFDLTLVDGALNQRRNLLQFVNGTTAGPPQADDIVIFRPSLLNPYGHVAVVAAVNPESIEIAQQNAGPFSPSRELLAFKKRGPGWAIDHPRVQGWLRRISQ
ncbi:CHAP domain-containing protein [Microvirga arabica]|uniref:CHAP domain-containing protein n=1 Tax=Microvirga arabica TaxID=1128671 RepID=A0ABV6YFW3_9HYPH